MPLSIFVPIAICVGAVGLLIAIIWVARTWLRRGHRRSPFTKDMLRGPGYTLRERIEELGTEVSAYLAIVPTFPLVLYAVYLQQCLAGQVMSAWTATLYVLAALGFIGYSGWKLIRLMRELRKLRLGLEAEIAVAEELNRLMHDGYTVFHDVPGDGPYNVDHVLVGSSGVYAVETKGRMKPTDRPRNDGHILKSNGAELEFPGWIERKPVEQARNNARSMAKWLSAAIGEAVFVQPVLVFPGWLVKRTTATGVPTFNAIEVQGYLKQQRDEPLSQKKVAQICHQLDTRCRTVGSKMEGARKKAS